MTDSRIAYSQSCTWWDSRDLADDSEAGTPRCPRCGAICGTAPDENAFLSGPNADVELLRWVRGRCYPSLEAARQAKEKE